MTNSQPTEPADDVASSLPENSLADNSTQEFHSKGSLKSLEIESDLFVDHFDPDADTAEDRSQMRKKSKLTSSNPPEKKAYARVKKASTMPGNETQSSNDNILRTLGKGARKPAHQKNEAPLDSIDMQRFAVPDIDERVVSLLNVPSTELEEITGNYEEQNVTDILFGDFDQISTHQEEPPQVTSATSFANTLESKSKSMENSTPSKSVHLSDNIEEDSTPRISVGNFISFTNTEGEPPLITPEKEFKEMMERDTYGDKVDFFWIDAREVKHTNDVYLFGKAFQNEKWESCCVRFQCLERSVMVLPKERLDDGSLTTLADVARELSEICQKLGIKKRSFKKVYRWYAFEKKNIPKERNWWVKMKYHSTGPTIPTTGQFRTFTELFGTQQSMIEMILLKRKIMGPCWLTLTNAQKVTRKISHCKLEFLLPGYKDVTVQKQGELPLPRLKVCSLSLISHYSESTKSNEIYGASLLSLADVEQEMSVQLPVLRKTLWHGVRKPTNNYVFPFQLAELFAQANLPAPKLSYSEKVLLEDLLAQISAEDPDILIGHNFLSYHLDLLLHRLQHWNIQNWSAIGRLKLIELPKLQSGPGGLRESSHAEKEVLAGRLVCDTYLLSKEYVKSNDYSLESLISQLGLREMGLQRATQTDGSLSYADSDTKNTRIMDAFQSKNSLFSLLVATCDKSIYATALALHLDIIPLTKRMTNITGNVWSRTLSGSRSERIEFLLLHKFHRSKFIVPDKKIYAKPVVKEDDIEVDDAYEDITKVTSSRRKPQYTGGMVLEPKRGLYDSHILLLDFNSLYPSIIQEFNLCFTTLERENPRTETEDRRNFDEFVPTLSDVQKLVCDHCESSGCNESPCAHKNILPKVLKELVEGRRQVKKIMQGAADEEQAKRLNIRQKALKLIANSMYGCLGFQAGRFYAPAIAQLVTSEGRNALQNAVSLVTKVDHRLDVIYGDTDSVMINTPFAENLRDVRQIAGNIKDAINKCYKTLEIDIDGVFRRLLLLRKKKYAALRIVDYMTDGVQMEREVKGLDLVRREWCPLSKQMCSDIIDMILSIKPEGTGIGDSIREYLESNVQRMNSGTVELHDFIITKALNREPEEYANPADHPHVCVAMRMKELKLSVQVGDLIPYVVGIDKSGEQSECGKKLSTRCFHPQEISNSDKIVVDIAWYRKMQFYPPIMRLLEYIRECDNSVLLRLFEIEGHAAAHASIKGRSPQNVTQKAEEMLDAPEIAFPGAKHLLVRCLKKHCQGLVDILPHKYLLECALDCLKSTIEKRSYEETEYHWLACPKCGSQLQYAEVLRHVKVVYEELKNEVQMATADYALHQHKRNTGHLNGPLFQQLGYFSSLFNIHKISNFLVQHLERSIAAREPDIPFLSQIYKAKGLHPIDIAEKLAFITLQSTKRVSIGKGIEADIVSRSAFDRRILTDDMYAVDLYDDLLCLVEAMKNQVHGYSTPIVDIIGCMR
ncbi:DNA polymerase I alpha catalytic subunit [Perkinsela sp. CCAP 1560/4]|nr:DNA polymerase I alpha catalytic subunit [Perkinsela sp. CCAP 1560/4]|eukprot:KNH04770.1 DNA polymerase I alpha catalytic subunit [Perkinsela sp. CCAP 1560/4]